MDPSEIQPSANEPAGAAPDDASGIHALYWDGGRLVPCPLDARASLHAPQLAGKAAWAGADAIVGGDEPLQEFDGDGRARIEYWVPRGDELVPATPEQVERFREYDRELAAQCRLQAWLREERRRARRHQPRRLVGALAARLGRSVHLLRAVALGRGRDGESHREQPIWPPSRAAGGRGPESDEAAP